ncbi:hypothetical protein PP175_25605 (plasmid) [Aneurinibacillus sp. Ricciae_BoGa-3]|uniref:hypothetical protein n=1 Tax=Aneurinibacillus sp. Ricciae_BoGa-3 TaxID=3022697 RepID=UPI0023410162|nr:hypothetical protein [Aneurinibacillus sp. Ricciae_BoGa-3]WCK57446.1 hypothetical protein PP175_25605 [Aneurinibacillus sp. Ricciae_BoGa-3]
MRGGSMELIENLQVGNRIGLRKRKTSELIEVKIIEKYPRYLVTQMLVGTQEQSNMVTECFLLTDIQYQTHSSYEFVLGN